MPDNMYPNHVLSEVGELAARQGDPGLVILDCRFNLSQPDWGRQAFMQDHIPGAYFMDIELDLSAPVKPGITGRHPLPHPEVVLSAFRAAGVSPAKDVVVYDQGNGMYAARAWWLLYWLGHRRTKLLNGGYQAWLDARMPVDNTWPAPATSGWQSAPDEALVVHKEDLAAYRGGIIDSRDVKRYTGEFEPIDPVAGHIPRAVCMPFLDNVKPDGTWKSKAELSERFADLIPHDPADPPVFYCGSGVSACHNLLAYHLVSGEMARLYAGSWSEYIHYYPPVTGDKPV